VRINFPETVFHWKSEGKTRRWKIVDELLPKTFRLLSCNFQLAEKTFDKLSTCKIQFHGKIYFLKNLDELDRPQPNSSLMMIANMLKNISGTKRDSEVC
jgi:hypothetical protein